MADLIAQVRAEVLRHCEDNRSLYEEEDIEKIRTEDELVKRFLAREYNDPVATIDLITSALRWWKRQNVGAIKASEFPQDLQDMILFQVRNYNNWMSRKKQFY